jgi:hypothetical protein
MSITCFVCQLANLCLKLLVTCSRRKKRVELVWDLKKAVVISFSFTSIQSKI